MRDVFLLLASLLALIAHAHAQSQLPYNPHRIVLAKNGSLAYVFAPASSSQASLSTLDIATSFNASNAPSTISTTLPFLSDTQQRSFIPISTGDNITVLSGTCSESADALELWRFTPSDDYSTGTWSSLGVEADNDSSISADFLSAGVPFSPTTDSSDTALYVFGGMCPFGTALNASNWLSLSNYSDSMLTVEPLSGDASSSRYELSITDTHSSPIPEAGLTMTPLKPWFSNTSTGIISQQQDFVLLGGHTQQAFINMSQVAIFSLPQAAWTFVTIEQSESSGSGELAVRDVTEVEPRSGHTAVLTEDGTRIVVLGGWVGDISTPAQPQLVILNIDQAYGGVGAWQWITPADTSSPYSDAGIYAHGAAMLPGGVMMVTGGRQISSSGSKVKRDNYQDTTFFNISSMTWSTSYVNPDAPASSTEPAPPAKTSTSTSTSSPSSSNDKVRKIGLGVGIGVGLAVLVAALALYLWFLQKRRKDRADRERQLRKVALGTDKDLSPPQDGPEAHYYPERRSASWHNMQERQMESTQTTNPLLWEPTPTHLHQAPNVEMLLARQAERTGAMMEVPSPTRGLRKNVASRAGLGFAAPPSSHAPVSGTVFRIDEEDETSQAGSIRLVRGNSIYSDPFQDPPYVADLSKSDEAAEQRKRELQGWAEDWQSAAESLNLSRNPSAATHGRTYSNLSQAYSQHHSSGRGSPEKSDTTESNSSDRSTDSSWQRSGTDAIGRSLSQRSVSAGYALFSGAVSRLTGPRNSRHPDSGPAGVLSRAPSNRSVSLNVPSSTGPTVRTRDRAETFSSLQSAYGPITQGEDQELLGKNDANRGLAEEFCTPPESPVKDKGGENKYGRASSLTRTGVKAAGLLGSVKRVFTGTGSVDVADRVANIEQRSSQPSPTKSIPAMSEVTPAASLSTDQPFWRGKRGAKDWDEEFDRARSSSMPLMPKSQSVIRRKPVPGQQQAEPEPQDPKSDDEWDIEAAVQRRVVQVMFTVPKETLRVVNADALSLISSNRSDIDHDDDRDREREISKMSSVREGDEDDQAHDDKGKQPVRDS